MNSKLRHIDQRQHWVNTLRNANIVKAKHVNTKENIADIFTKGMTGPSFKYIRNKFIHECTEVCTKGEKRE
jgi:hypothetical protein